MKVRMLAVISILSLAAWLPIRAQQAATPAAPAAQAPATAPAGDDASKATAKHECCCAAKTQSGQGAVDCCHGKSTKAAKADCCEGKSGKDMPCCEGKTAKEMPCCAKGEKADQTTMQCCAGMKEGQCQGKDGKTCCSKMNAQDGKACCAGKAGQCPMHANGK